MNDSRNPNDDEEFEDGFFGKGRSPEALSGDYLKGSLFRYNLEQRENGGAENDPADQPVDELAKRRVMNKIAENHSAKYSSRTTEETTPLRRRPPMALAASVLVGAMALGLFMQLRNDDSSGPDGGLRDIGDTTRAYAGEATSLETLRNRLDGIGAITSITEINAADATKNLRDIDTDNQSLNSAIKDDRRFGVVSLQIDDTSQFESVITAAESNPALTDWIGLLENDRNLGIPENAPLQLDYLFILK